MTLLNQFRIPSKYLNPFNYKWLKLHDTLKKLNKFIPDFQNISDKECKNTLQSKIVWFIVNY